MLTQTPSLFFIDNKTSAGQQSASHTVRMTPPSPYRGKSWGSTLMSLPCKGKVKIINVGPIDGLAGGHRGFSADFWTSAPLKAMNSYSQAWPKRKTAWVLSPWKGWYKSEDEPGSFFPLFLWPIALFFLSQTHIHAHTRLKESSRLSLTHTSAYALSPPSLFMTEVKQISVDQIPVSKLLHLTVPHSKAPLIQQ